MPAPAAGTDCGVAWERIRGTSRGADGGEHAGRVCAAGEIECERFAWWPRRRSAPSASPRWRRARAPSGCGPKTQPASPMTSSATWCAPPWRPDHGQAIAPTRLACCSGCRMLTSRRAASGSHSRPDRPVRGGLESPKTGTTPCAITADTYAPPPWTGVTPSNRAGRHRAARHGRHRAGPAGRRHPRPGGSARSSPKSKRSGHWPGTRPARSHACPPCWTRST